MEILSSLKAFLNTFRRRDVSDQETKVYHTEKTSVEAFTMTEGIDEHEEFDLWMNLPDSVPEIKDSEYELSEFDEWIQSLDFESIGQDLISESDEHEEFDLWMNLPGSVPEIKDSEDELSEFDEWIQSVDFESIEQDLISDSDEHEEFDLWMNLTGSVPEIKDSEDELSEVDEWAQYLDFKSIEQDLISELDEHEEFDLWINSSDFTSKVPNLETELNIKQREIKNFIHDHNIQYLVHFTRLDNLENILKYGLVSREFLAMEKVNSVFNDSLRLDNFKNSICTSISFPNYKMFYKLRSESPETEWIVLKLDPCILYELTALFCYTNAASRSITNTPISELKTVDALKNMFSGSRSNNIPCCFTTNPQAEVVFLETISTRYIKEISSNTPLSRRVNLIKNLYSSQFNFTLDPSLFKARSDYDNWKK